jgi:hypothetical protein
MTCEEARLQFAGALEGAEEAVPAEFENHLESCAACREQLDILRTHWAALGLLADAEPSSNLRRNFYQALEAYQDGLRETQAGAQSAWWQGWWPKRPAFQVAFSLLLLAAGAGAGYITSFPNKKDTVEVSHLRAELTNLRQLITLSLLQQDSAVERLQGVTWAQRVDYSDEEVLGALLRTINGDPSVDVRLAAADALRGFSKNPLARRGLLEALARQTSPLVRIAVIDLLVELRERSAASQMQQLLEDPDLDPNVRKRAQLALHRLE